MTHLRRLALALTLASAFALMDCHVAMSAASTAAWMGVFVVGAVGVLRLERREA